ncbi:MAG: LysM peptidoglycan-binding domain-containing protein [Pseudomonadota bacterium]
MAATPDAYTASMNTLLSSLTTLIRSEAAQPTGLAVNSETAARLRDEINDLMAEAKAIGKSPTHVGRGLTFMMMKQLGADFPPWLVTKTGRKDASILFMGRSDRSLLEQDRGRSVDHLTTVMAEAELTKLPTQAALVLAQATPAPKAAPLIVVDAVVETVAEPAPVAAVEVAKPDTARPLVTFTTNAPGTKPLFYVVKSSAADTSGAQIEIRDAKDASATTKTVVVQPGQTLASLAVEHFGTPDARHQIYALNRDVITDPDVIEVGQVLVLPQ